MYVIWLCDRAVCHIATSVNLVGIWLVAASEIRDLYTEVTSPRSCNSSVFATKVQSVWSTVWGGITNLKFREFISVYKLFSGRWRTKQGMKYDKENENIKRSVCKGEIVLLLFLA